MSDPTTAAGRLMAALGIEQKQPQLVGPVVPPKITLKGPEGSPSRSPRSACPG